MCTVKSEESFLKLNIKLDFVKMSNFLKDIKESMISIPQTDDEKGVTIYIISVHVGEISWTVRRRYKQFVELHDKLVNGHGIAYDILPPKKVIGNRDEEFIKKRQIKLQKYLIHVLYHFKQIDNVPQIMPKVLALFLDFHKYDLFYMIQELAADFSVRGNLILSKTRTYVFDVLHIYAISEMLKNPLTRIQQATMRYGTGYDRRNDFQFILNVCNHVPSVTIEGCWSCVDASNIVPNHYSYDLTVFENMRNLTLRRAVFEKIHNAEILHANLVSLRINQSRVKNLREILVLNASNDSSEEQLWERLAELDVSQNKIREFDESIRLMPNLRQLTANYNQISELNDIRRLTNLTHLSLSNNRISSVNGLHTCVGKITHIDLSHNEISSLKGFEKLECLEDINLKANKISDITEIQNIKFLVKLNHLVLTMNPVVNITDYRIKVLKQFGDRSTIIWLDEQKTADKELTHLYHLKEMNNV